MKNFMFIIGMMFSLFTMSAADKQTQADVYLWNHESIRSGRERSPSRLPTIDIVYNSDCQIIQIFSSMDCDATVFVYGMDGNLIDSAESLDTILSVTGTNSQILFVRIESNSWYATAFIEA